MDKSPSIFYLAPDSSTPSWGLGILYHHVAALCSSNYNAFIVHEKAYFNVDWLNVKVPVLYWNQSPVISASDILVVPEVMVNVKDLKDLECRKILFVQASSFLFKALPENETHVSLGFESAIGIMPHMVPIIEEFTRLKVNVVPPFVASYFFKEKDLDKREKIILVFPKFQQQDYGIIRRLVSDKIKQTNEKGSKAIFSKKWKLVEMKGKTHKQVAELMKRAAFFIATNTFESFNASVVEAMAAGCISMCYEAFGPRDYVKNGVNAFVFNNNEAYDLCSTLFKLIDSYDEQAVLFSEMRNKAYKTAKVYSYENTKEHLLNFYKTGLLAS